MRAAGLSSAQDTPLPSPMAADWSPFTGGQPRPRHDQGPKAAQKSCQITHAFPASFGKAFIV